MPRTAVGFICSSPGGRLHTSDTIAQLLQFRAVPNYVDDRNILERGIDRGESDDPAAITSRIGRRHEAEGHDKLAGINCEFLGSSRLHDTVFSPYCCLDDRVQDNNAPPICRKVLGRFHRSSHVVGHRSRIQGLRVILIA